MKFLSFPLAVTGLLLTFSGKSLAQAPEVLVYLTSGSTQTQGMALVLSTQMLQQKAKLQLLLCDDAAELALANGSSDKLKPFDKSPAELLDGLVQQGVQVDVCALYLPNKTGEKTLKTGVGTAKPPQIAAKMLDNNVKVFSF